MTLAQMSQESFCCEVWCRLFYGRHYNNTDQWPKDKLEWPKKERIKTGKLLGSCCPFIYLTSRTSKFHVMPLWMHLYSCSFYEEKNNFSSSLLTLVTEGSTQDENDMSLQWFLIKFILILGKLLLRQFWRRKFKYVLQVVQHFHKMNRLPE